ncbi:MAG: PQQ-binding-like beta-propeller repeat protein [Acidobacteria bacterium]|nr:PQQ-binding-like beta-propeller repeat protein [Acidobacteriota bacterium]
MRTIGGIGKLVVAAGVCLTLACAGGGQGEFAEDWPAWRGPRQDGTSTETGLVSSWSPGGENMIWKAEFIGRSTPVVVNGRVCVIGRVGEEIDRQERVACFDAENGDLLWEDRFNVYHTTVPFNRVGWASLAADPATGNIYAHGVSGQMIGYAPDGKRLWSRFMGDELGHYSGYGGRTQTPLVVDDLMIISFISVAWGDLGRLSHRYFAMDKMTGEIVWVATPGGMAYDFNTQSTPVTATIDGRKMLVTGSGDGWIYGLRVATGEKVWGFQLSKRGLNSTVLVHGNRVFATHSEENLDASTQGRLVCFEAVGEGDITKTAEVWRNDEVFSGFPSPAYHDGVLYLTDNSANLHALDAATGEQKWEYSLGTVGKSSAVVADGKIYATEVNGRFHILKPGADGPESLDMDELKVEDGRYAEIYSSPAVAYGRVFFAPEGGLNARGDSTRPLNKRPLQAADVPVLGQGEADWLQVVPAIAVATPGQPLQFAVRALDGERRPVAPPELTWSLEGLDGAVSPEGVYTPGEGGGPRTGTVKVSAGGVEAMAWVRVLPAPPWLVDFESMETGTIPPTWIRAGRSFKVDERDGGKVLHQAPSARGIDRRTTFIGRPDSSGYTIQADVLSAQKGRRRADLGLINSGYILDLQGAHQRVQIRSRRRICAWPRKPTSPGRWTPGMS